MHDFFSDPPRAAVLGWPIAHSLSPLIHSFWLRHYALRGAYGRIAIPPEQLVSFFSNFEHTGLVGGNVTLPHKEHVLSLCAEVTPVAQEIGAVNTFWVEEGRLKGTNTDGVGFLANMDTIAPGWDANKGAGVILGAGGACRAVLWALIQRGFSPIFVVNRNIERAETLCRDFSYRAEAKSWTMLSEVLPYARLLVNTTSLGMKGQPPLNLDVDLLPEESFVTDVVYLPLQTELLQQAAARGLRTVDGLGMLLHQAVPGFEKWFGVRPLVTPALRAVLSAKLSAEKEEGGEDKS